MSNEELRRSVASSLLGVEETALPYGDTGRGVALSTTRGAIRAILHEPDRPAGGAVLWVCGARGGYAGPAEGIYETLSEELTALGLTSLRLDYRHPADLDESVWDALIGVEAPHRRARLRAVPAAGHPRPAPRRGPQPHPAGRPQLRRHPGGHTQRVRGPASRRPDRGRGPPCLRQPERLAPPAVQEGHAPLLRRPRRHAAGHTHRPGHPDPGEREPGQTIPPRFHAGLADKLEAIGVDAPFDQKRVRDVLAREYRSSGYNLRRLTRDQTSKLTGQLNQARQTELGLDRYRWRSSADERVRPLHQDYNGQIFAWNDPPADGHPGEPIQCRYVAVAVFN